MSKQNTTPTLTNSEVALLKKGLELLDAASIGFEEQVAALYKKLKPEEEK